ncbi:hypothetical protein IAU59_002470 [Kwoniella sp. CBS 9459]
MESRSGSGSESPINQHHQPTFLGCLDLTCAHFMCDFLTIQCICEDYVDSYYPDILRTLEELDVIFAHAHLTERRPTLVAAELPKLSDHQVQEMTERYDIHGGAASEDPEAVGAPVNTGGAIDTSLPPVHPPTEHNASGEHTRVPTPTEGAPKVQ